MVNPTTRCRGRTSSIGADPGEKKAERPASAKRARKNYAQPVEVEGVLLLLALFALLVVALVKQ